MANGVDGRQHPLKFEAMTIAKLLIEREQEKLNRGSFDVKQLVSAATKHSMATIVVRDAIPEAGIRHIQMLVEKKMGKRMKQRLLRETGGIKKGASVSYSASIEESKIDFRVSADWSAPVNCGCSRNAGADGWR
jgi:hypothetical protein